VVRRFLFAFLLFIPLAAILRAEESDAVAISENIQFRHAPHGTILDPIFEAPVSERIVNYTRCGDSALWTGFYLAAEAYRYNVTRDPSALANAWRALSGLRLLVYVTGNNQLARCAFPVESPYASGLLSEESSHGAHTGIYGLRGYYWIGNTSRDQYIGVFFGLAAAWDLIDDPAMGPTVADLVWRMLDYLQLNNWNVRDPGGALVTTFSGRPEQQLMMLAVGRHILPDRFASDYTNFATFHFFLVAPPISLDTLDVFNSYFKFNLNTVSLYNLIRLENNPTRRAAYENAYDIQRRTTDGHQNAHFNMIDHALRGPDAARDAETVALLDAWLLRSRRDFRVDLRGAVPVCLNFACRPIPVELRVPTDFLWQRSPFQLTGGGDGFVESAGIDYILPYWMARYYGVIPDDSQSSDTRNPRSRRPSLRSLNPAQESSGR
jgi:hypothetical protein